MPESMSSGKLSQRFKACYYLSALNLGAMALPALQAPYIWIVIIVSTIVNAAACVLILRGVETSADTEAHERLATFGKRGIFGLGLVGGLLLLVLAFTGRLGRQALPFMLFGFGYFSVALKVLENSTGKSMEKLGLKP